MNVYNIVYVSSLSGVFIMVIGMCICSLYRHNVYIPKQIYENGDILQEGIELTEYDSNDDEEDKDVKVISDCL